MIGSAIAKFLESSSPFLIPDKAIVLRRYTHLACWPKNSCGYCNIFHLVLNRCAWTSCDDWNKAWVEEAILIVHHQMQREMPSSKMAIALKILPKEGKIPKSTSERLSGRCLETGTSTLSSMQVKCRVVVDLAQRSR